MAITTSTNLAGNFYERYNKLLTLIPQANKIQEKVPFVQRDKQVGNLFHTAVVLTNENCIDYALRSDGGFDLSAAIPMQMGDAQIQGTQMMIRSQISYDAAVSARTSQQAFEATYDLVMENMVESMRKRLELQILYGATGLSIAASSSNVSATQTRLTIKSSEWSAGIFAGLENAQVNFYTSNTTLVSSGADAVFTILKINADSMYVYVTGTATGITALDSAISGAPNAVYMYFKGAFGKEAAGIKKILTNTGTLFNIDAATYSLWAANQPTTTGELTFQKIQGWVAKAVVRGLDEDVDVYINPLVWIDVANRQEALRRFDSSYSKEKGVAGVKELEFYGANGAKVSLISHILVKQGDCFILPMARCQRPGACDIFFGEPGKEKDQEWIHYVSDKAAYELRGYSNQAFFIETPARCVYGSGFLPTTT